MTNREKFEKWLKDNGGEPTRAAKVDYWKIWNAGRESAVEEVQQREAAAMSEGIKLFVVAAREQRDKSAASVAQGIESVFFSGFDAAINVAELCAQSVDQAIRNVEGSQKIKVEIPVEAHKL